ncbi:hypothetical protein RB597_005815 [Gaeumannomyces tritici]
MPNFFTAPVRAAIAATTNATPAPVMEGLQLPPLPGARSLVAAALVAPISLALLYLVILNWAMCKTPARMRRIAQRPWTKKRLNTQYAKLRRKPITIASTAAQLPPKLNRRYVVTSGLVGNYIVLQLLARGQPPKSIRIVDFQKPHRNDMVVGPAADVDFARADISSAAAVNAAFGRPWPRSVAHLPLTVFHTAAIIVPSDRSDLIYHVCRSVNVNGTANVVNAARAAGADVLISTSSGSASAGRPFTVTDPNPPIRFQDVWFMLKTLSVTPFRILSLVPVLMLALSHAVEWYCLLPVRHPRILNAPLPRITSRVALLKPPLFSITTHFVATNGDASKPVADGGLGYKGLITTMEGIVQEVLEWNREHEGVKRCSHRKYISSISLADEIRKISEAAMTVGC